MKTCAFLLAILILGASFPAPPAGAAESRATMARTLYTKAMKRVARGSANQRRIALGELEQAALLDPGVAEYALAAGRLCLQADMLHQARVWGERVLERDSSHADAHFLVGSVWRKDWLVTADEVSLDRAVVHLSRSARRRTGRCESWLMVIPLLLERGEIEGARGGAELAWEADSSRADVWLARACTLQRSGDLDRAAALFEGALARLPERERARFLDLSPLLPPAAAAALEQMSPGRRADFVRKFWDDSDPDLVTPLNEARLEFLTRATHAFFLYYNPKAGAWDTRGDLYVRFGPPRWMDRNPAIALTYVNVSNWTWMVWGYPELGMRIWMAATNPLGTYNLPVAIGAPIPHPFPDSLARRADLMAVGGGRAVFPRIPPGTRPLAVRCALARFEGEAGRRLLANVECPGGPAESLWVEWAVFDSAYHERARAARSMAVSACAPAEARSGSFTADLPAGRYRVGVSVRDGAGRRGVLSAATEIRAPEPALGLSDVVVTCGQPQTSFVAGQPLRLELNPGARLSVSDQLTAYFEIYHLAADRNGWSRFQYVYTVRSAEKDPRTWIQRTLAPRRLPQPIEASREEETPGSVRRQYVTVPIRSLPAGRYEIEIRVQDLSSGASATGKAEFVREG